MADYDRERLARLFDDIARPDCGSGENTAEAGTSIPALAGRLSFERLELRPYDVLLDVGTGTGEIAPAVARVCRQVIGIDVSRRSLELASRSNKHILTMSSCPTVRSRIPAPNSTSRYTGSRRSWPYTHCIICPIP